MPEVNWGIDNRELLLKGLLVDYGRPIPVLHGLADSVRKESSRTCAPMKFNTYRAVCVVTVTCASACNRPPVVTATTDKSVAPTRSADTAELLRKADELIVKAPPEQTLPPAPQPDIPVVVEDEQLITVGRTTADT
jgi:hypothetical protein